MPLQFDSIRRSAHNQRGAIIRSICITTLLGASERIFADSLEFKAFSNGLNVCISSEIPSFIEVRLY